MKSFLGAAGLLLDSSSALRCDRFFVSGGGAVTSFLCFFLCVGWSSRIFGYVRTFILFFFYIFFLPCFVVLEFVGS